MDATGPAMSLYDWPAGHLVASKKAEVRRLLQKGVDFPKRGWRLGGVGTFGVVACVQDVTGPALRGALLGLEIGTSQSTLPVVAGRYGRTPHIVLSGAFLALRASDCNGWPRRWVSGRRRDWDPGSASRIPA